LEGYSENVQGRESRWERQRIAARTASIAVGVIAGVVVLAGVVAVAVFAASWGENWSPF